MFLHNRKNCKRERNLHNITSRNFLVAKEELNRPKENTRGLNLLPQDDYDHILQQIGYRIEINSFCNV